MIEKSTVLILCRCKDSYRESRNVRTPPLQNALNSEDPV